MTNGELLSKLSTLSINQLNSESNVLTEYEINLLRELVKFYTNQNHSQGYEGHLVSEKLFGIINKLSNFNDSIINNKK